MIPADIATVARKDLRVAWHRRGIRASLVLFPLLVAVGLNLVIRSAVLPKIGTTAPADLLPRLLTAFLFFFVIGSATLPTAIAAYSFVGEKVERSLEPLLATPVSDFDVLLGKALAALVPSVVAVWLGGIIFIVFADRQTSGRLGVTYLPDATSWIILGLVVPLSALVSVLVSVLISVRSTDTRSAQQGASLIVIPFVAIYILAEVGVVTLDPTGMLVIAGILAAADVVLFVLARAAFDREEILTRWR